MFTIRREIPTQMQRDGIFAALYGGRKMFKKIFFLIRKFLEGARIFCVTLKGEIPMLSGKNKENLKFLQQK
jgi:hypothetical protein